MTPAELRSIIRTAGLSNSAFARRIGISPRHMRKLLAGDVRITPGVAADILRVAGGEWPRDEWIVGSGQSPERREYIIHTAAPRFIARLVMVDEDMGEPHQAADLTSGITFDAGDIVLCEMRWLDPPPVDREALTSLLATAVLMAQYLP